MDEIDIISSFPAARFQSRRRRLVHKLHTNGPLSRARFVRLVFLFPKPLACKSIFSLLSYLESPEHDGLVTVLLPQNSLVVPQKPYLLQHTLRGHFSFLDHCKPQPGSHSLQSSGVTGKQGEVRGSNI